MGTKLTAAAYMISFCEIGLVFVNYKAIWVGLLWIRVCTGVCGFDFAGLVFLQNISHPPVCHSQLASWLIP